MKSARITFDKISDGEKSGLSSQLRFNLSMREFESSSFYKIPFAQATDLIMRREVFVTDGFAFVPSGKLVSIVTARFR
jgi:DNA primase large subunit